MVPGQPIRRLTSGVKDGDFSCSSVGESSRGAMPWNVVW
jgi:hypothetical protein